jgi:3-oxoacyl-[acyl-carrier-protein] synthase II
MTEAARRVVITGIGPVTPVGIGKDVFWESLKAGKSGIDYVEDPRLEEYKIPVRIGGQVKNFDVASYFEDPKQIRSVQKDMDQVAQFAVIAAKYAIQDSKINLDQIDRTRAATFVGTGIGGIRTTCDDTMTLYTRGIKAVGLRSIIRLMPNAASGFVAIHFGLQGRAKSDATACASGLDSMVDAFWYIKNNIADVMLTGGTESCLNPLAIASFSNMTALSKRESKPQEASCPFDKRRDGFVMSEGSVVFVLEEYEHAKKRGAHIYAEIIGAGASCDAYHITAPSEDGSGGARAIEAALACAGLSNTKSKIDYIHAHGTSTPLNDARETLAIKKVFGDHAYKLCVSSTKSMTGHLIGAAGPVGVAATALACQHNIVPPTINYKEADPVCDLDYIPNEARERTVNYALVQALGFGGHNTVVVLKKYTA